MRPSARFVTAVVAWSIALFGVWYGLKQSWGAQMLDEVTFALPVMAVVLASNTSWRRRLSVSLGLLGILAGGAALAYATGTAQLARADDTPLAHTAAVGYHVFRYAVPLAVLVWASGGDLTAFWDTAPRTRLHGRRECPICGQTRAGLHAHIRDVHGEAALKKLRERGEI